MSICNKGMRLFIVEGFRRGFRDPYPEMAASTGTHAPTNPRGHISCIQTQACIQTQICAIFAKSVSISFAHSFFLINLVDSFHPLRVSECGKDESETDLG